MHANQHFLTLRETQHPSQSLRIAYLQSRATDMDCIFWSHPPWEKLIGQVWNVP